MELFKRNRFAQTTLPSPCARGIFLFTVICFPGITSLLAGTLSYTRFTSRFVPNTGRTLLIRPLYWTLGRERRCSVNCAPGCPGSQRAILLHCYSFRMTRGGFKAAENYYCPIIIAGIDGDATDLAVTCFAALSTDQVCTVVLTNAGTCDCKHVVTSKHQVHTIAVVIVEDKAPVLSSLIRLLSCFKCGIFRGPLEQIDRPSSGPGP